MGTADYLAPEQALDFHGADIRADIYGLGCTFYYLLTGRPPFAGATLAEKLVKHQQAEPPAIDKLCSQVPSPLVRVIRRMLAKRPEQRYQTPAEVAAALGPVRQSAGLPSGSAVTTPSASSTRVLQVASLPSDSGRRSPLAGSKRRRFLWGALAGLVLLTAFLGLTLLGGGRSKPVDKKMAARPLANFLAQFDTDKPPAADQLRQFLTKYPDQEEKLQQELVAYWQRDFGTDRAPQIGELLMLLRSPLDQLNGKNIPAEMRVANLHKGLTGQEGLRAALVAVVKDPEASTPLGMTLSPDGSILAIAGKNNTVRFWKLAGSSRNWTATGCLPATLARCSAWRFLPTARSW